MGKLAWIDLSTGTLKVEEMRPVKIHWRHGLASSILPQFPLSKIDPLGPENVLVFSTGR
jgi:aldehyde:ferredoxin oxidoreductase